MEMRDLTKQQRVILCKDMLAPRLRDMNNTLEMCSLDHDPEKTINIKSHFLSL